MLQADAMAVSWQRWAEVVGMRPSAADESTSDKLPEQVRLTTFDKLPEAVRLAIEGVSAEVAKLREVLWAELKLSRPALTIPAGVTPAGDDKTAKSRTT